MKSHLYYEDDVLITIFGQWSKNGRQLNPNLFFKGNGMVYSYYDNGLIESNVRYDSGYMFGDYIDYYLNGSIKSKGKYEYNKKEGYWEFYDFNQKLTSSGLFREGHKLGVWKYYDVLTGKVVKSHFFKQKL